MPGERGHSSRTVPPGFGRDLLHLQRSDAVVDRAFLPLSPENTHRWLRGASSIGRPPSFLSSDPHGVSARAPCWQEYRLHRSGRRLGSPRRSGQHSRSARASRRRGAMSKLPGEENAERPTGGLNPPVPHTPGSEGVPRSPGVGIGGRPVPPLTFRARQRHLLGQRLGRGTGQSSASETRASRVRRATQRHTSMAGRPSIGPSGDALDDFRFLGHTLSSSTYARPVTGPSCFGSRLRMRTPCRRAAKVAGVVGFNERSRSRHGDGRLPFPPSPSPGFQLTLGHPQIRKLR